MLTLDEKLSALASSNSFLELNKEVLPTAHKEDYYFVSYSHKDYKTVLKDILLLEDKGINIWYDSDMHIGENWENIAETYISKFQCKGIIFYLSENSILSPACNKEIEYVLENDKQFFSINIPLPGKRVSSGHSMLLDLIEEGHKVSDYTISLFEKAFSDKILYLSESDTTERKVEKIQELVGEDLFTIRSTYSRSNSLAVLDECKDNTMVNLSLKSNYRVNAEDDSNYNEVLSLGEISACAFTNSFKLKEVNLPKTLTHVRDNAFRNSHRLKKINLDNNLYLIGDSAFRKCKSLEISHVGATHLLDSVFWGCESLTDLTVDSRSLGRYCFAFCKNLKRVRFTSPQYLLPSSMFDCCESLEYLYFNNDTPNYLVADKDGTIMERGYLEGSKGLKDFTLVGKVDISKAENAFSRCSGLEKFTFLTEGAVTLPSSFLSNATSLKEVEGAERFTHFERECLRGTGSLNKINLSGARYIGERAFEGSGVEKVSLPNATEIARCAFLGSNARSLLLGKDMEELGSQAFAKCHELSLICLHSPALNLDDPSVFYDVTPSVLLVSNLSQLKYFMQNNPSSLHTLYIPTAMDTEENLSLIPFPYERERSKIEGYVRFSLTPPTPYEKYVGKRVVINTHDDEIRTRITAVGYDEEIGEYYVDCFARFYDSEIIDISLDPYYDE